MVACGVVSSVGFLNVQAKYQTFTFHRLVSVRIILSDETVRSLNSLIGLV